MERHERPAVHHFSLIVLAIICLVLQSCANDAKQNDELGFYRNMSRGVYNFIAEVEPSGKEHILTLRGAIDKQALETFRLKIPTTIKDAKLGDINADGIPEVYCLGGHSASGEKSIHAFTLDGQKYHQIDVAPSLSRENSSQGGEETLEIRDNHVFHHFTYIDSTGNKESGVTCYTLQRQNGTFRLLPKPELEDLSPTILNQGVATFQIGDSIGAIELPSDVEMSQEEREFKTEEGPFREQVFTLIANGLILMDFRSHEGSTIDDIFLHDTHFRTSEGIGVRSRLGDFIVAYPNYKLWYTYVSDRFIAETPVLPNVQFLVERDAYAGPVSKLTESRSEQSTLSIEDFTPEARIEQIRIF